MARRRAVSKEDKALEPDRLPLLYKTLVPLTPDRHSALYFTEDRTYDYAADANAIPLTADEFPLALRHYPIVLSGGATPTPLALVGMQHGQNDFVTGEGAWKEGAYVPAYLRRYPFALVRESNESDHNILCADLSSTLFTQSGAQNRKLFTGDGTSPVISGALDFCKRYDTAVQRTRLVIEEAAKHDLFGPSAVTISRAGKTMKVEGFQVISEEKLRALPDDILADLARRGVLNIFAAHFMSLTNFSDFGSAL
jgi:SapC protein